VLATSTLHAFWDLFLTLGVDQLSCYVDAAAYPIARWGAERAAARGMPVEQFPHHGAGALRDLLAARRPAGRRPVVVTDGLCPGCGQPAPLRQYLRALRPLGGLVVVDDTQALGILGRDPGPGRPYGRGGGGSLRLARLNSPDVLVVSSLAKAFGVPVAVIAGSGSLTGRYERRSETRVHCSPPSFAHLRAAEHALEVNRLHRPGDRPGRIPRSEPRAGSRGVPGRPAPTTAPHGRADGTTPPGLPGGDNVQLPHHRRTHPPTDRPRDRRA